MLFIPTVINHPSYIPLAYPILITPKPGAFITTVQKNYHNSKISLPSFNKNTFRNKTKLLSSFHHPFQTPPLYNSPTIQETDQKHISVTGQESQAVPWECVDPQRGTSPPHNHPLVEGSIRPYRGVGREGKNRRRRRRVAGVPRRCDCSRGLAAWLAVDS